MKVLFITSRNAYSTSGELRLIKNRAETLLDIYGVTTDFEVVRYYPHLKRKQEPIRCGSYNVYGHHIWDRPFVMRKVYNHVKNLSKVNDYDAVIFSSGSVYSILPKVKQLFPNAKFIADIHGAIEELVEFPAKSFLINNLRKSAYKMSKRTDRKYLKMFDGFFAVSDALIDYLKKEFDVDGKQFFKVPCSISDSIINADEINTNRSIYRSKYNLQDNQLLFVYSGGTSPWQCIDKSVQLFNNIKKNNVGCSDAKLLIMTGQPEKVKEFESDDIIIDSYPGSEVRKVLCAGDFAFLLRDNFVTNNVAYPNKFLEYVSCGLKVIATPYVHDVANQIRQYNLGIICDYTKPITINAEDYWKNYLNDVESRNELFKLVSFKSTLKPFIDYISK